MPPVAANRVDRHFVAAAPNQRLVAATSEFAIGNSRKLYLAAVLDLFSRLAGSSRSASVSRCSFSLTLCPVPSLFTLPRTSSARTSESQSIPLN